jgi:hypothetical protein
MAVFRFLVHFGKMNKNRFFGNRSSTESMAKSRAGPSRSAFLIYETRFKTQLLGLCTSTFIFSGARHWPLGLGRLAWAHAHR